jgi:hypothetical protein
MFLRFFYPIKGSLVKNLFMVVLSFIKPHAFYMMVGVYFSAEWLMIHHIFHHFHDLVVGSIADVVPWFEFSGFHTVAFW